MTKLQEVATDSKAWHVLVEGLTHMDNEKAEGIQYRTFLFQCCSAYLLCYLQMFFFFFKLKNIKFGKELNFIYFKKTSIKTETKDGFLNNRVKDDYS